MTDTRPLTPISSTSQRTRDSMTSPLLRLFYKDNGAISLLHDNYSVCVHITALILCMICLIQELEKSARRVFDIPEGSKVVLSTEIPGLGTNKLKIDPPAWAVIKSQVKAVWVTVNDSQISSGGHTSSIRMEIEFFHYRTECRRPTYVDETRSTEQVSVLNTPLEERLRISNFTLTYETYILHGSRTLLDYGISVPSKINCWTDGPSACAYCS